MKTQRNVSKLVEFYSQRGYKTEIIFVDVDPTTSMTRAIGRFLGGGRLVSPEYIATHDLKNQETARALKDVVDTYRFWDNRVPFGEAPILVEEVIK